MFTEYVCGANVAHVWFNDDHSLGPTTLKLLVRHLTWTYLDEVRPSPQFRTNSLFITNTSLSGVGRVCLL